LDIEADIFGGAGLGSLLRPLRRGDSVRQLGIRS
jgi:hypothetical protein